jgi:hypothetical protein
MRSRQAAPALRAVLTLPFVLREIPEALYQCAYTALHRIAGRRSIFEGRMYSYIDTGRERAFMFNPYPKQRTCFVIIDRYAEAAGTPKYLYQAAMYPTAHHALTFMSKLLVGCKT